MRPENRVEMLINEGVRVLKTASVQEPWNESIRILAEVVGTSPVQLEAGFYGQVGLDAEEKYLNYINERATGLPIQYITGSACFMGFDFEINKDVLIPRNDTEMLALEALKKLGREGENKKVLELGTGSGCLAIVLAKETSCLVDAVDISAKAIGIARRNAARHGMDKRINFIRGNMLQPENFIHSGGYDLIISNPPYVSDAEYFSLPEEVRKEPALALRGGKKGLKYIKFLMTEYKKHLKGGGEILIEIGYSQKEEVKKIGGPSCSFFKDLNGIYRVVKVS